MRFLADCIYLTSLRSYDVYCAKAVMYLMAMEELGLV